MKNYNLIKTRAGERSGRKVSTFQGSSENDTMMLKEAQDYLRAWLDSYTSISEEEKEELFSDFDGNLRYDVWTFSLEQE